MELPSVFTDDELMTVCRIANIDWPHPFTTLDRTDERDLARATLRGARSLRLRGLGSSEVELEPAMAKLAKVASLPKVLMLTTLQTTGEPNPQLPQFQIFGHGSQFAGMISSWDGAHEFVNVTESEILGSIKDYLGTDPVDSDTYRVIVCRDPQTQQLWGHAFGNGARAVDFTGEGSYTLGSKCIAPTRDEILQHCTASLQAPLSA